MVKQNFRQDVTDELIQLIEKGDAPWQKPWNSKNATIALEMPHNAATGRPYRGGNAIYLMAKGLVLGGDPRWCTLKQANDHGWKIKKGSKATSVEYWQYEDIVKIKNSETGREESARVRKEHPNVFYAKVFHASQIEGIPEYEPSIRENWNPVEQAEAIIKQSGARIYHDQQDKAYYSPLMDDIHLPPKAAFTEPINYYETALHELSHWTGGESRLNRDLSGRFGSESYAKEELRAEIASLFLSMETGVPFNPGDHGGIDISNTAAYVKSWVQNLKEDRHEIFRAAKDAETIADYLIGLSKEKDRNQTVEAPVITTGHGEILTPDKATIVAAAIETAFQEKDSIKWARYAKNGYELSSVGDQRFSALNAKLSDGRTIEEAYQLDIKGYRKFGNDWRLGKGKPPLITITAANLYSEYKALWQQWANENPALIHELREKAYGKTLTDKFASTPVSQAHALADILNSMAKEQATKLDKINGLAVSKPILPDTSRLDAIQKETKNATLPECYRSEFKGFLKSGLTYDAIDKKVTEKLLLSGKYTSYRIRDVVQKHSPVAVNEKKYGATLVKSIMTPAFKKELEKIREIAR